MSTAVNKSIKDTSVFKIIDSRTDVPNVIYRYDLETFVDNIQKC